MFLGKRLKERERERERERDLRVLKFEVSVVNEVIHHLRIDRLYERRHQLLYQFVLLLVLWEGGREREKGLEGESAKVSV